MSRIAAMAGAGAGGAELTAMLDAVSGPGELRAEWRDGDAALGLARPAWQCAAHLGGRPLVEQADGITVVSDAALYYRNELFDALRVPASARSDEPAAVIHAAYAQAGMEAVARLEGDFAFVLWDARTRLLVAARDFAGGRPLYYAATRTGVALASSIEALLASTAVDGELNLAVLAETAAGLWGSLTETCYEAIRIVPPGALLMWRPGAQPVIRRYREPLRVTEDSRLGFEDAAAELRNRLQHAIRERSAGSRPTAVWMSGGVDSTAIFGAGRAAGLDDLAPVSVSYPEGDPGREDEAIAAVGRHWNVPVRWLRIDDLPMLADLPERMARQAGPFAHPFANWNAGLATASRDMGARVALGGYGGDQLFHVSDVYLADHLVRGRWPSLLRDTRGQPNRRRHIARWALHPVLPDLLRRALHRTVGWPAHHYLSRPLPFWFRRDFADRHHLTERAAAAAPTSAWRNASTETEFYLHCPHFPRILAEVTRLSLEQGVEIRSPLYDARVLELALTRPRSDRNDGRVTKRLLRRAVLDDLPVEVTRPRASKGGLTSGYFERSVKAEGAALAREVMREPLLLAELGVIEPSSLEAAWGFYERRGGENTGTSLLYTLQAELWLRGLESAQADLHGGRSRLATAAPRS
jgi:asparagine synthase (glutamine-hydrolysing)